jgi:uncharacterized protein YoxC
MKVLKGTFGDVTQINQNLTDMNTNMRGFNEQLIKAGRSTETIATDADRLMKNTDSLVQELQNKVFILKTLTEPVEDFARVTKTLTPSVEQLQSGIQHMAELSKAVREVNTALADFHKVATESKDSLRQTAGVVANLIRVTQRLLLIVENSGTQ